MEKDKGRLNVRDVTTWLWPGFAVVSCVATMQVFALHDVVMVGETGEHPRYPWAQPVATMVGAASAWAMVSAMGSERDTLRSHRDWRIGAVVFVCAWNAWIVTSAGWREDAAWVSGHAGEAVSFSFAGLGVVSLRWLRDDFYLSSAGVFTSEVGVGTEGEKHNARVARARRVAPAALVASAVGFALPLHTSASMTIAEMWPRCLVFAVLFFMELAAAVMDADRPVDWRFQWCTTSWVLAVNTPALACLAPVALYMEVAYARAYWAELSRPVLPLSAGVVPPPSSQPPPPAVVVVPAGEGATHLHRTVAVTTTTQSNFQPNTRASRFRVVHTGVSARHAKPRRSSDEEEGEGETDAENPPRKPKPILNPKPRARLPVLAAVETVAVAETVPVLPHPLPPPVPQPQQQHAPTLSMDA